MKVSCLPVSLFPDILENKMSFAELVKAFYKCGLDGVDISMSFLFNHTPVYLQKIKDILSKEKMSIIMATAYPDFTHFGDLHTLGKDGIRFFTETKAVTTRWFDEEEMKKVKIDTWDGSVGG